MISLVLAILSSFSISILVKLNELKGVNTQIVLASNYISASLLGWSFVLREGLGSVSSSTWLLGIVGGMLWPGTFYMLMWGVRQFGISLAGSVARLSLVIPVLFALLFLGEQLNLAIAMGILATFAAFILLSPMKAQELHHVDRRALWYFPLLVFCFGIVDFWVNLFNTVGVAEEKFVFMLLIFTFASLFSWAAVLVQRLPVRKAALWRGLVLGMPNFFSTYFLMESLRSPLFARYSSVVYALYSVLGVSLAFAAGALVWKEKVTRANVVGVMAAIVAIVLLNLR